MNIVHVAFTFITRYLDTMLYRLKVDYKE